MSSEIRSFIRQVGKWFMDPDSREKAMNDLKDAIILADEKGEYAASYAYLMRYADFLSELGKANLTNAVYIQASIRASLMGDEVKILESKSKIPAEHPYRSIADTFHTAQKRDGEKHFYLLDLEYKTIFGDFAKVSPLPMIDFEDEEEALVILEDFYDVALYHAHIIERKSLVKERVDIAVGKLEKLDAVETVSKYIIS